MGSVEAHLWQQKNISPSSSTAEYPTICLFFIDYNMNAKNIKNMKHADSL
jgi:hypothetical protein